MTEHIYLMPNKIATIMYKPDNGVIVIETPEKLMEIPNKNLHYFEYLAENIAKNLVIGIDLKDKLSVPNLDFRYDKCYAIFRKHVLSIEYDSEDDGLITITTDVGNISSYNNSKQDYKEMLDTLIKNKMIIIKNMAIEEEDIEIPDFSKVKKLKFKSNN